MTFCPLAVLLANRKLSPLPERFVGWSRGSAWWTAHPECLNRKVLYTFTCPTCGREFTAYGNKSRRYGKTQKAAFGTIYVDRNGTPDDYTDGVVVGNSTITLSASDGMADYVFNVPQPGVYDIAVQICFPFWDKNGINISLEGTSVGFGENRLWWPYWRKTCWTALAKGKSLSAGSHMSLRLTALGR
ncbi:hypothetical protein FACS1894184_03260 [Clostridia bacterium]|nr:hypothetical protein FACS1894184_03260 [Clostridia bacterium]